MVLESFNLLDLGKIIIADIVLSGDNALVIGMAAAGLAPDLRKKAIFYGMVIAAVLRVVFALIATQLLDIPGLLFIGGLLLCYVCWGLYKEIRAQAAGHTEDEHINVDGAPRRTLRQALIAITIADVSMSLDNVLAVAAIADGNKFELIFGLGLAIVLMAFFATMIMKLLTRYPWISWLGLVVLMYVAAEMLYKGLFREVVGVIPFLQSSGFI